MSQRRRESRHEPITPALAGQPPGWIVRCQQCPTFALDAHGDSSDQAVASVLPVHALGHDLWAESIDYTAPTWGKDRDRAHPLYGESR